MLVILQAVQGNEDLLAWLAALLTLGGGTLGIASWAVTAGVISFFSDYIHRELNNDEKRWLALGVPVVLVVGAYLLGALLGGWAITGDTLFNAGRVLLAELAGAKVLFTATKGIENKANNNGPLT